MSFVAFFNLLLPLSFLSLFFVFCFVLSVSCVIRAGPAQKVIYKLIGHAQLSVTNSAEI